AAVRVADEGNAGNGHGKSSVRRESGSEVNRDALRFGTAQGETGVADLHQQRIGADRATCDNADRFALGEAEFAQTVGNGIVAVESADGVSHGRSKGREFGKGHGRYIQIETISLVGRL